MHTIELESGGCIEFDTNKLYKFNVITYQSLIVMQHVHWNLLTPLICIKFLYGIFYVYGSHVPYD